MFYKGIDHSVKSIKRNNSVFFFQNDPTEPFLKIRRLAGVLPESLQIISIYDYLGKKIQRMLISTTMYSIKNWSHKPRGSSPIWICLARSSYNINTHSFCWVALQVIAEGISLLYHTILPSSKLLHIPANSQFLFCIVLPTC